MRRHNADINDRDELQLAIHAVELPGCGRDFTEEIKAQAFYGIEATGRVMVQSILPLSVTTFFTFCSTLNFDRK